MIKNINLNYSDFRNGEYKAVRSVLKSKHLQRGVVTKIVEEKIAEITQSKYAILVSSATGGLIASLKACGIGNGDEVITTPFSHAASANSIYLVGAVPIYSDINSETFNLDVKKIEKRITNKTKAILTVDLYGNPCDYHEISTIAKRYNLKIIADSSQSFGSKYNDKMRYPNVDIQVFSFFGLKPFTSGEGGACITNNKQLLESINSYINHGQKRGFKHKYSYTTNGYNFRLTDIQAAIIESQLTKFDEILSKHYSNAQFLNNKLSKINGIQVPTITKNSTHSYSKYTIKINSKFKCSRKELISHLKAKGIESDIVYPKPLHFYKPLSFGFKKGDLPVTEKIVKQVLTIPVHQNLSRIDLNYIVETIRKLHAIK